MKYRSFFAATHARRLIICSLSLFLRRNALLALFASGILAGTLHAQTTHTWNTTTIDPTWTTPSNWTGGVAGHFPGDGNGTVTNEGTATDIAFFGAGNATTLFNMGIDFDALNGSLTLGAIRASSFVRIGNSSAAAGQTSAVLAFIGQTINGVPNTILLTEGSSQLILATRQNNGNATFDLSIALASATDNVIQSNGSGVSGLAIRIATAITGSGSNLIIGGSGSGTVRFEGSTSNTYSGTTTISNSILDLAKSNGIAIAGDIVIGDGIGQDILRLSGPTLGDQIADTSILTFNGTGADAGTLRMNARNETVGGLVSAGGAGVVENGGSFTIALTVNVNGTARDFSGIVRDGSTGPLAFTKSGNAAQTLSGSVANTYTGKTLVNSGTLILNKTDGVTAISSTGATGSTLSVPNTDLQINTGGTVQLGANNQIADTAKVGFSGGTLNLNGFSEGSAGVTGIGALTLTANSTIDFGVGALSVIQFAGVNGHLNNAILQIINWTGIPEIGGAGDRLLFAGIPSDFSNVYQQSQVTFNDTAGYGLMDYAGYYEVFGVTPVPEPGTWAAGILVVATLSFSQRKRLWKLVLSKFACDVNA